MFLYFTHTPFGKAPIVRFITRKVYSQRTTQKWVRNHYWLHFFLRRRCSHYSLSLNQLSFNINDALCIKGHSCTHHNNYGFCWTFFQWKWFFFSMLLWNVLNSATYSSLVIQSIRKNSRVSVVAQHGMISV